MAKGNLFLGFGRGAVGDVVVYRANGEQVTRARNRHPKNPQSALQLLQRVVLKTSSMAYGLMQEITNHSFQGFAEGTECQSRFNQLNIQRFREQLADEINSGDADIILTSPAANFSYNGASLVEMNPYKVSEGSLTPIPVQWGAALTAPAFVIQRDLGSATPTYNDVLGALGIVSGDQLTFLGLSCDDTVDGGQFNGFDFARVIMEPASGDLTLPFLAGSGINDPNDKNRGSFNFSVEAVSGAYYLAFTPADYSNASGVANAMAAGTVILSRNNGSVWQRSSQSLVIRPDRVTVNGHLVSDREIDYLGDAVQSFMSGESSLLYLNQAGGSGKRGQIVVTPKLTGVLVGQQALSRGGNLTIRANSVDVSAVMSGASDESTYTLALIQQGQTVPFKSAEFVSSTAVISDIGITANRSYTVALMEDDAVIDVFGTIYYNDEVVPEISTVKINGTTVGREDDHTTSSPATVVVTASTTAVPSAYMARIIETDSGTEVDEAGFENGVATIEQFDIEDGMNYTVCLVRVDTIVDRYCTFHKLDI